MQIILFIINIIFANEITNINESEQAIASKQNYIVFSDFAFLVGHSLTVMSSTDQSKKYSIMAFAIGFLFRMNSWNDYKIKPSDNNKDEYVKENKQKVKFNINKWKN